MKHACYPLVFLVCECDRHDRKPADFVFADQSLDSVVVRGGPSQAATWGQSDPQTQRVAAASLRARANGTVSA